MATTSNIVSVTTDNTVKFNVGGRIFEVRRALLDVFPNTMLARSASDLWNKSADVTAVVQSSTIPTANPIFIDRDSIIFSLILDYMRNNGVVELPVSIPRDTFLKELEYYGFDNNEDSISCITCKTPVLDTFLHIDKLHTRFQDRERELNLIHDIWVFAYACHCELLTTRSLKIMFTSCEIADYDLPKYLLPAKTKTPLVSLSRKSITNAVLNLKDAYAKQKQEAAGPTHSSILHFNQYLSEYGFECQDYVWEATFPRCKITLKYIN